ncbi:hypothetical protein LPB67_08130 [Undibacterium sp. Jales W-56]|uniref:hypothetical protein n=1 Tax=Undibacterium sp. Jales W-56 TaxID=2897325 RepID=UPI0021CE6305|nr:hypothetical protein [Undibacterium sp. Jales W-56]MCU6433744.1 hypothetical protein [Undibacterium sp. Jales W-56]
MSAFNKFSSTVICSSALIASVLALSSAYKAPVSTAINDTIPTVTIIAKRLNAEQKLAYDLQSTQDIQTVMISAKRLSAEQKLAMDRDAIEQRQAAAKYAKTIQQSV